MKIPCAKCEGLVEMEDPPRPRILNSGDISVIVADHPKQGYCLACKLPVVAVVASAHLELRALPIEPAETSQIIVMPGRALGEVRR
jgi:hypothetical protein